MKLFVIAGEASGDLHGANLLRAIHRISPEITFQGFGGPLMAAQGMSVVRGLDKLAFMGFSEVIRNLPTVMTNFSIAKEAILADRPNALLLIDYPGFNLRLAKWARKQGIPVLYYIAPQAWAWKESRVKAMRTDIHRLMVILPFEKEFFAKHGIQADFVGHPILDTITNNDSNHVTPSERIIAILPGSRKQEVKSMLPIMLSVANDFPDYRFVVGKAPGLDAAVYESSLGSSKVVLFEGGTQALLRMADAALVTSGTATLETALFGVPQVVCYRGNALSVMLARKLIKVNYISLANLILNREAVVELIQSDLNADNLQNHLAFLLSPRGKEQAQSLQSELWKVLGGAGASANAARIVVDALY